CREHPMARGVADDHPPFHRLSSVAGSPVHASLRAAFPTSDRWLELRDDSASPGDALRQTASPHAPDRARLPATASVQAHRLPPGNPADPQPHLPGPTASRAAAARIQDVAAVLVPVGKVVRLSRSSSTIFGYLLKLSYPGSRCQRHSYCGSASIAAVNGNRSAPRLNHPAADGEPQPAAARASGKVRLENPGQHVRRDPMSVIRHANVNLPVIGLGQAHLYAVRISESGILENVEQHFTKFICTGNCHYRVVRCGKCPLHTLLAQPLELQYVVHNNTNVHQLCRCPLLGRRSIPAESARDFIQVIDLAQDASHILVQHTAEISLAVSIGPAQVLHAQPDGSKGILDLMRHLPGHLAPCKNALCTRELGNVVQRDHSAACTAI